MSSSRLLDLPEELLDRICISLFSQSDARNLASSCRKLKNACEETSAAIPITVSDREWAKRELAPHPQLLLRARTDWLAASVQPRVREAHNVYMSNEEWHLKVTEAARQGAYELLLFAARHKQISVAEVVALRERQRTLYAAVEQRIRNVDRLRNRIQRIAPNKEVIDPARTVLNYVNYCSLFQSTILATCLQQHSKKLQFSHSLRYAWLCVCMISPPRKSLPNALERTDAIDVIEDLRKFWQRFLLYHSRDKAWKHTTIEEAQDDVTQIWVILNSKVLKGLILTMSGEHALRMFLLREDDDKLRNLASAISEEIERIDKGLLDEPLGLNSHEWESIGHRCRIYHDLGDDLNVMVSRLKCMRGDFDMQKVEQEGH